VLGIQNLKNAVTVLSKHQEGLVQMTDGLKSALKSTLRDMSLKHRDMIVMTEGVEKLEKMKRSLSLISTGVSTGVQAEF